MQKNYTQEIKDVARKDNFKLCKITFTYCSDLSFAEYQRILTRC